MGLIENVADLPSRLADRLVAEPFYVVRTTNEAGNRAIRKISPRESIAYFLKRGYFPIHPKTALVASGGSAKVYYLWGFVKKIYQTGIDIHRYIVTSASSLLGLLEITKDPETVEKFALEIPELLPFHKHPLVIRAIKKITPRGKRSKIESIGHLVTMLGGEEITLNVANDADYVVTVNRGAVDTTKLEERLREFCGNIKVGEFDKFKIVATDYTARKAVVLNDLHPEMPLYRAFISAMAVPSQFKPSYNSTSIIVDGGVAYHFPFFPELLVDSTTVIAVRLGHPYNKGHIQDLSGADGFLRNMQIQEEIRISEMTRRLVEPVARTTVEDLAQNGDRRNLWIYLDLPDLSDVPPLKIDIPLEKRHELIERGYKAAENALKSFRRPMTIFNSTVPILYVP